MLRAAEIFQTGMILQREKSVRVWGSANPGSKLHLSIQAKQANTIADENGNWTAELPPLSASNDETLMISDGQETLLFSDVAVGEVWIGAGQSNMEFWMRYEKHCAKEKERPSNPNIRFYDIPKIAYDGQKQQFDYSRVGRWRTATPEDIEYFSSVSYYFERVLEAELNVPVGVIGCDWGGTTSSAWMSAESAEQTGKPWVEDRKTKFAAVDMDDYWKNAGRNPNNDTGNPFEFDFNEFMLPRTPSEEEIKDFFDKMDDSAAEFMGLPQPQMIPGSLYEHMVKEAAPYTVRGVLWYQGESDEELGQQELYQGMLTALISDWRKLWHEETLPFLIVQLPGFDSWFGCVNHGFHIIRQCQQNVVDADDNLYLCSISDAGEQFDIHPKNKMVVGERLALLALGHIYGKQILCDAPRFAAVERNGGRIVLSFVNADGGLVIKGDTVNALVVLEGEKELQVSAGVEGACLILELSEKCGAVQINFAKTAWYQVNLYNQSGVPAIPFSVVC